MNNDASLQLNIIPVNNIIVPDYNQEQLYLAVEAEYYAIRDQIEIAIVELVNDIANEDTLFTMPTSADSYDFFPLDKAGINTLPYS